MKKLIKKNVKEKKVSIEKNKDEDNTLSPALEEI